MTASSWTPREKKLVVFGAVVSVVAVAFIISTALLAVYKNTSTTNNNDGDDIATDGVCKTDTCIETADAMKLFMDQKIKPCDNFREFACGNFKRIHKDTDGTIDISLRHVISQAADIVRTKQRDYSGNGTDKAIHLYHKCLDFEGKNEDGIRVLREMLVRFLGVDLPVAVGGEWNGKNFDLFQSFARQLRDWGHTGIMSLKILPSASDPSKYIPTLMILEESEGLIPPVNDADIELINQTICTIYPKCRQDNYTESDLNDMHISNQLNKLFDLLKTFPQGLNRNKPWLVMRASTEKDPTLPEYEIKQLIKKIPQINWLQFFRTALNDDYITESFKIALEYSLDKFELFIQVIVASEDIFKREIANEIGWEFLSAWGKLFSPAVRMLLAPGMKQEDICFLVLNEYMGYAVGKMYTDKYITQDAFEEIEETTRALKSGFRNLILEADWLDAETRTTALKKLVNMKSWIAGPLWARTDEGINKHYDQMAIETFYPFDYAFYQAKDNYLAKERQMLKRNVDVLNDLNPGLTTPLLGNAMYFLLSNNMYYMLPVLVNPLFVPGRPRAVKFGSFGYVSGHEITHGFDSNGRYRDENGQEREWWSEEADKKYKEKSQCFIDTFSNIRDEVTNKKLNGTRTLAENIADSGGIRAAFRAYRDSPKEKEGRLKGMEEYTEDQLFFISAGQTWCSDVSVESLTNTILTDTHSPSKYRAIVPFQNDPEFSNAFHCDSKSAMNPPNKCKLW